MLRLTTLLTTLLSTTSLLSSTTFNTLRAARHPPLVAVALAPQPPATPPGPSESTPAKRMGGGNAKKHLPQIAVIGRPNVGKSTIANRLTKSFTAGAVVFNEPGVTRDRIYGEGFWNEHEFTVVDTGGIVFDDNPDEVFLREIRQQAMVALKEASAVLLVVDGQAGCTVLDEQIAAFLRRDKTPVVLAVNKCESVIDGELQAADFWQLGMGTPHPVSGLHGTGMGDVMDELVAPFPPPAEVAKMAPQRELRVAILGRPNVGKSSLLNRLTNTDRAIVCDLSGTTRDAIDQSVLNHGTKYAVAHPNPVPISDLTFIFTLILPLNHGTMHLCCYAVVHAPCLLTSNHLASLSCPPSLVRGRYTFVDTAGVRKAARVSKGVEELMVRRSLKAARRSDVCLLVVDATEGVSEQEGRLAKFIVESVR